eukprot:GDKI01046813.1.p1 GENE.GDKI01046813.1~~GDKI01046813.1.p1  ORF type:complete len:701 (+),score=256.80 GDKI01046813.1:78-2105(+)
MEDQGQQQRGRGRTMGKVAAVKNKTPAPVQITAEQLLREAVERQADEAVAPKQRIVDAEELQDYRVRKRKEYEDYIRRQRQNIGMWIKYAMWEAEQKEFRRARSVFERALGVEYQNAALWLKYIEMETKNKFINSARNLYDRVTQLLPRVDQFWFKYAHMEEILGNYAGCRTIYERWMEWAPEEKAWMLYVHFEERCGEIDRARKIFERFLGTHPSAASFLKFCKFEERHRSTLRARAGFEKAIELLPSDHLDETFYLKFAQFEERQKEYERAKVIYQQALNRLPKGQSEELYRRYVSFQKKHGAREEIEDVILDKRRFVYEEELKTNPRNYDTWFDYIRLEESAGQLERIRDVYERAVANIPPLMEKRYWKRYIYLWINYALFEETQTGDAERARAVWDACMKVIPAKQFTFQKIYTYYADFEVRHLELDRARRVLGRGLAESGKEKVFSAYAGLELRLGNLDRCRKIYAKWVEMQPHNPKAWTSLVELEQTAEEHDRARGVCEIAVQMEQMDRPELIWKCYIDFESSLGEIERARSLYERLLEKTQHFKVFKGFAEFEWRSAGSPDNARKVLQRGLDACKEAELQEERAMLLEHWLAMEREIGEPERIEAVQKRQPKKVKRKRNAVAEDGTQQGWEEYVAYVFPDDGQQTPALKILEAARAWKKKKAAQEGQE